MRYAPLFSLDLIHPYYADQRCPDFLIEPTTATQRLLNNFRCIMRPRLGGVQVVTALADAATPLIRMVAGMRFSFRLVLRNPDVLLFTEIDPSIQPANRLYTNAGAGAQGPVLLDLTSRESALAFQPDPVFAEAEVSYTQAAPSLANGPGQFQILFQPKQVRWQYYLVTNEQATFGIDESPAAKKPIFGAPTIWGRSGPAPDHVAAALAEQYPATSVQIFRSKAAIPCRQQAQPLLYLYKDNHQAIKTPLPHPSIRDVMIDSGPGNASGSYVLFRVIKFLTNRRSTSGG
jgi:hypothetical protein